MSWKSLNHFSLKLSAFKKDAVNKRKKANEELSNIMLNSMRTLEFLFPARWFLYAFGAFYSFLSMIFFLICEITNYTLKLYCCNVKNGWWNFRGSFLKLCLEKCGGFLIEISCLLHCENGFSLNNLWRHPQNTLVERRKINNVM
jgi:hypothetical protein